MRFLVRRLRQSGVRLKVDAPEAMVGELSVTEMRQSAFGRAIRVARLQHPDRPDSSAELFPPLFDATLLQMTPQRLVLTGFEREAKGDVWRDVVQTWVAVLSQPDGGRRG